MTRDETRSLPGVTSFAAGASALIGLLIVLYGLSLLSVSALGAAHLSAIGLCMVVAGLLASEFVGERVELSRVRRHRLAGGFAGLAFVLLVLFVAISGATFTGGEEWS